MQYTGMKDAFSALLQMKGKDAFKDKKFVVSAFRDLAGDHVNDWFLVKQVYYLNEMSIYRLVDELIKGTNIKTCLQKTVQELQMNFVSEDGIRVFLEALLDVYGASSEKKSIYFPAQMVVFRKEKLTAAFKELFGKIDEWASNEEITGVFMDLSPELRTPEGHFLKIVLDISEGKFRTLMKTLMDRQDAHLALFEVRSALEKCCLEKKHIDVFLDSVWEVYFPQPVKPAKPVTTTSQKQTQSGTGSQKSGSAKTQTSQQGSSAASTVKQKVSSQSNIQQSTSTNNKTNSTTQGTSTTGQAATYTTSKQKKKGGCLKYLLILLVVTNIPTIGAALVNKFENWKEAREIARMEEEYEASDIGMAEEEPVVTPTPEGTPTPTPSPEPTPTPDPLRDDPVGTYTESGLSYAEYSSTSVEQTDLAIESVETTDYSVVTDLYNYRYFVGDNYTFAYPKNLYSTVSFSNEHAGDNVHTEFSAPDGSYLAYTMDASFNKPTADNAERLKQNATADMINTSVLVEGFDAANGIFKYYVTGQDAANPNLTVVKTINWGKNIMIYRMVLKYPTPVDEQDRLYKKYYEEFLYRRCEFTDSTAEARTYEEFLGANS